MKPGTLTGKHDPMVFGLGLKLFAAKYKSVVQHIRKTTEAIDKSQQRVFHPQARDFKFLSSDSID